MTATFTTLIVYGCAVSHGPLVPHNVAQYQCVCYRLLQSDPRTQSLPRYAPIFVVLSPRHGYVFINNASRVIWNCVASADDAHGDDVAHFWTLIPVVSRDWTPWHLPIAPRINTLVWQVFFEVHRLEDL